MNTITIKTPTAKERRLRSYRLEAISLYVAELQKYNFDVVAEFVSECPKEKFSDYVLTCSGNAYMSLLEECITALEDFKANEFVD